MTTPSSVLEYQKRRRAIRVALISKAKENLPCADCRQRFPAVCMDFDHVRGTKVGNVSGMQTASIDTLEAEIAKCDVVCANCHRLRTEARRRAVVSG